MEEEEGGEGGKDEKGEKGSRGEEGEKGTMKDIEIKGRKAEKRENGKTETRERITSETLTIVFLSQWKRSRELNTSR